MGTPTKTATVTVKITSPEHCKDLQRHGWTIGVGSSHAFGWKRPNEVTKEDCQKFEIEVDE